jgi:hypothetical protein
MFVTSRVGAVSQFAAVVLAIVALSPVPLAMPSGIAVAMIGLMGVVALLSAPVAARAHVATPGKDRDDAAIGASRLRDESGARA